MYQLIAQVVDARGQLDGRGQLGTLGLWTVVVSRRSWSVVDGHTARTLGQLWTVVVSRDAVVSRGRCGQLWTLGQLDSLTRAQHKRPFLKCIQRPCPLAAAPDG
jgi:hypothetical protein